MREAVELAYEGLDWLGVSPQSIGVCGLNPHAGDGGALGMEEKAILNPVLRALAKKGIPVSMALPADTLFTSLTRRVSGGGGYVSRSRIGTLKNDGI